MKEIMKYPKYFILPCGKVFSGKTGEYLKPSYDKQGYARVSLYNNGKSTTIKIHRLVAEAYIPNPENKTDVNHKDGNKSNNDVSNLEWATRSENIKHAFNNGLKRITKKQIDRVKVDFSKSVIDVATGKEYNSLKDASVDLGINYSTLKNYFRPNRKNKTNLRWKQN